MSSLSEREQGYLRHLASKGWEIAQRLAAAKAGQDFTLADIPVSPSETRDTRIDRLRAYLDLVESARKRLLSNDGTFGYCTVCARPFTPVQLGEMPWIDRCRDCERAHATER